MLFSKHYVSIVLADNYIKFTAFYSKVGRKFQKTSWDILKHLLTQSHRNTGSFSKSLPNNRILDLSNLKVFTDNSTDVTETLKILFGRVKTL